MRLASYDPVGICLFLCTRRRLGDLSTRLLSALALRGTVRVLDGGNCFQAYPLVRALRARATQVDALSRRVWIRRAFTAYQMLALLESTPTVPLPCVILDPLATLYDETLAVPQARLLMQRILEQLNRLKKAAPLFILISPPPPQRHFLQEMLSRQAEFLFHEQEDPPTAEQPPLL